jgi:hypothetical protein
LNTAICIGGWLFVFGLTAGIFASCVVGGGAAP